MVVYSSFNSENKVIVQALAASSLLAETYN